MLKCWSAVLAFDCVMAHSGSQPLICCDLLLLLDNATQYVRNFGRMDFIMCKCYTICFLWVVKYLGLHYGFSVARSVSSVIAFDVELYFLSTHVRHPGHFHYYAEFHVTYRFWHYSLFQLSWALKNASNFAVLHTINTGLALIDCAQ